MTLKGPQVGVDVYRAKELRIVGCTKVSYFIISLFIFYIVSI